MICLLSLALQCHLLLLPQAVRQHRCRTAAADQCACCGAVCLPDALLRLAC